jgi:hypothetical protein
LTDSESTVKNLLAGTTSDLTEKIESFGKELRSISQSDTGKVPGISWLGGEGY